MDDGNELGRSLGLLGATGVGVGAIVGGGVLALAGVAFATTGPSAILAFALNGLIALLTALCFAEMSAAVPVSGGTYAFSKRVLTIEVAFVVGWVVWFASIVASVLYALGFASYASLVVERAASAASWTLPFSLSGRPFMVALALAATLFYTQVLVRKVGGGSQWPTVGKLVAFAILILGGAWALAQEPASTYGQRLTPFFAGGSRGLLAAMGYTFIALQGFELIAAVGGEVKDPSRTIPRAMLLSLGLALTIYVPFLLVVAVVGVGPGETIVTLSAADPATVVARAAERYLGSFGFWLVIVAAVLSMLSGLQANLFAASRMAFTMARDRTLPSRLGRIRRESGAPAAAAVATAVFVALTILVIPDVASAGAAASLVFLVSFALVHWTNVLMRRRTQAQALPFRVPFFPLVPAIGGSACVALALLQARNVPSAGAIALAWMCLGWVLYLGLFARRARVVDASAEAIDPELVRLRGRSPLVLVPVANPANAAAMIEVASAMAPPAVGRVLLLSVVSQPEVWDPSAPPAELAAAQEVLGAALTTSFANSLAPEALTVVAHEPWREIARVARTYRCESLLVGLSTLDDPSAEAKIEGLMSTVDVDVVVLRATPEWRLSEVRRVLVPMRGRSDQSLTRARLLGSLQRGRDLEVIFLGVLPEKASDLDAYRLTRELSQLAGDEVPFSSETRIVRNDSVAREVAAQAGDCDLVILGLRRLGRRKKVLGETARLVAEHTDCGLIMISRRG